MLSARLRELVAEWLVVREGLNGRHAVVFGVQLGHFRSSSQFMCASGPTAGVQQIRCAD